MSYRCQACLAPSQPGSPMKKHIVKRPNGQSQSEVPVCGQCKRLLDLGESLRDLMLKHAKRRQKAAQNPVVKPAPTNGKHVAVWGDRQAGREEGVLGTFDTWEKADEAAQTFLTKFGSSGTDAWVRNN
jgi:hypothetical protein